MILRWEVRKIKIEGVGMDLKYEILSISDRDGCEIGVEEKSGID